MRLLLILLIIFNLSNLQERKQIIRRMSAHQIYQEYNILPTDSVISFENKKFLIHQIEDYKNKELIRVSIWKPLGYLEFSQKKVLTSKKFLASHDLRDTLCFAEKKGKEKLLINGKTYYCKKKDGNTWYLETRPKKGKLYVLVYE